MKIRIKSEQRKVRIKIADPDVPKRKITVDIIEQMFDMYCRDVLPKGIAEVCGVNLATVRKYINYGDPSREVEPFISRRARILRAALQVQDGRLVERIAQHSQIASAAFGTASSRLIHRYRSAIALDDEDSMSFRDAEKAKKIALEPELADVGTFHRVQMDLMKLAMHLEDPAMTSGVNVTVNQSQGQQQGIVDTEDVNMVYEHLGTLAKAGSDDQRKMASLVEKASIKVENT